MQDTPFIEATTTLMVSRCVGTPVDIVVSPTRPLVEVSAIAVAAICANVNCVFLFGPSAIAPIFKCAIFLCALCICAMCIMRQLQLRQRNP
uniref:Uncharacterized protein n=1 Tax=Romanomermis culicivorax TaxID=13658 RepID=A0A915HSR6_ROMCU